MKNVNSFSHVKIEENFNLRSNTKSINFSYFNIIICILLYSIFQLGYLYTGGRLPNYINTTTFYYPFTEKIDYKLFNIEFLLSPIEISNRFINLDFGFVRLQNEKSTNLTISMNSNIKYKSNNFDIISYENFSNTYNLNFLEFDHISNLNSLLSKFSENISSISLNLTFSFSTDILLKGIKFPYSYGNSYVYNYLETIRIVFFSAAIYSIFSLIIFIKPHLTFQYQIILYFLAFTTLIALNPLHILLKINNKFYDLLFISIYQFSFRFFSIYILLFFQNNQFSLTNLSIIKIILFISFYTFIEFLVQNNYNNNNYNFFYEPINNNSQIEQLLTILHLIYCLIIFYLIFYTFLLKQNQYYIQSLIYSFFILVSISGLISSKFFFEKAPAFNYSSFPSIIYITSSLITSIMFLFFDNSTFYGYQKIEET